MHFNPREGKKILPGDFMEKRADRLRPETLNYTCEKCGDEVLTFASLKNVEQIAEMLCEKCFNERTRKD